MFAAHPAATALDATDQVRWLWTRKKQSAPSGVRAVMGRALWPSVPGSASLASRCHFTKVEGGFIN